MNIAKKCGKCDKLRLLSMFNKRKRAKDGLDYWCKQCKSEQYKQQANEKIGLDYFDTTNKDRDGGTK